MIPHTRGRGALGLLFLALVVASPAVSAAQDQLSTSYAKTNERSWAVGLLRRHAPQVLESSRLISIHGCGREVSKNDTGESAGELFNPFLPVVADKSHLLEV
jgi:hypothetical protein